MTKPNNFKEMWKDICDMCKKEYGIEVGNNASFVAEAIFNEAVTKDFFSYVECGVYRGTTFIPLYHLCKKIFSSFAMYALDSFSGFPQDVILNENDTFHKFEELYKEGRITKDHFESAKERCMRLSESEHLKTDYFKNYAEDFFDKCKDKKEITIVKCSFSSLKSDFRSGGEKYDLVFLDCDLYLSYKDCLEYFKNRTDIFIFDEYYSLKYPGARIACDEFVGMNQDWKFFKKIETDPYFERWGIRKSS